MPTLQVLDHAVANALQQQLLLQILVTAGRRIKSITAAYSRDGTWRCVLGPGIASTPGGNPSVELPTLRISKQSCQAYLRLSHVHKLSFWVSACSFAKIEAGETLPRLC